MKRVGVILLTLIILTLGTQVALSQTSPPPTATPMSATLPAPQTPQAAVAQPDMSAEGRSSTLNFEDEIVEGMNKNPFDSLTHVGKNDDKNQRHLYRKKMSWKYEIKLNIREMGLLQ